MERLKIALTIHHELDPNSGAPGTTLRLAEGLTNLGHSVTVYGFNIMPRVKTPRVQSLLFPVFATHAIRHLISRTGLDVVDASTGDLSFLTRTYIRDSDTAVITRSHGLEHLVHTQMEESARRGELHLGPSYYVYHHGIRLAEVTRSLRIADGAIFVNNDECRWAIDHLGLEEDRTYVTRNGISEEFIGGPVPESSISTARIGIAIIGGHLVRKGAKTASDVISTLLRERSDCNISWFGADTTAVRAGLDPAIRDQVHIVERYQLCDLPRMLSGHQILLFMSQAEGFGKVLIEAMACGLAVVATDIPGPRDIVKGSGCGVLVQPRDDRAAKAAIEHMLGNRLELDRMRLRAHEAAQRYSWLDIAVERIHTYEAIIERKRRERYARRNGTA